MVVFVVFVLATATLLAYESWAVATHRPTITEIIRRAYAIYPPMGFLVGLACGLLLAHFFWQ